MKKIVLAALSLGLIALGAVRAQAPTGAVAGRVTDPTGAAISGARVAITSRETGLKRPLLTGAEGDYSTSALLAGVYEVTAEAPGFQRLLREAIVAAGSTTTVNLTMQLGATPQTVTVEGASAQIHYDAHDVGGVVTRPQIEGLPLNGRSFLELAKLEPGAQQPAQASNNRTLVPLLGAPAAQNGRATRVTVDGGSIMQIGNGGAAMGFSQEVVQEFQVSTVNFDLSTGATASGAVNIVTRSGGNQLHGSAFYFFRDHKLSAYPALARDASNPHPFFQRQQFGLAAGGPICKDRTFLYGTFERNDQRGVFSTLLLTPEFAPLSRITPSPTHINQFSVRADFRLGNRHFAFLRHSHEGSFAYGTSLLAIGGGSRDYPSAWTRQRGWTDQSILGLTSQLRPNLVSDLRFSYFFVSFADQAPREADCPGCLGTGAPSIAVNPDLFIGSSLSTSVLGRRYHLNDVVVWQKGRHRIRFGGDWETAKGGRTDLGNEPVTMTLYSPKDVRGSNIPLPASFLALPDILQLPVQTFTVGIGDAHVPQEGFGRTRIAPLVHLFYQDTWHLRPRLSVDYGVGWTYDAPLNYDLAKPAYLAPVLGERGLGPTRKNWKSFSPSAGFAWSPMRDAKTVIRGGAGIYYDFQTPFVIADSERVSLGPRGVGRGTYPSSSILNPLIDVPDVPFGTRLDFLRNHPTSFTGATLMRALPAMRADLAQRRGDPNNRDFSVTNIEVDKQGSIVDSHLPSISATHVSLGLQHEIVRDLVISTDFVFRQFKHLGPGPPGIDFNRFFSTRGPVLPNCSTDAQRNDPKALCSVGPISVFTAVGHARYQGLLVRAEKRFSRGWQFLGSYAYSSNVGHNFGNGFNSDNWLGNYGPLDRDVRHILSFSGLVQLPKRFELGFFVTYNSKPPFSAFLGSLQGGLDLNGDGTRGDLLPGTRVNQFNRGLGKDDLRRLVDEFNRNYAGKKDALGTDIRPIRLPENFEFGDRLLTHDLRLSRLFIFGERWRLTLIGEVFNLFNIANLSGRSGDLLGSGFGQPTSRVTQVFGSGGPRAFQLGARVSF